MYERIFTNLTDIKCVPELNISIHTLIYIDSWKISLDSFIKITEILFNNKQENNSKTLNDLLELEKNKKN